ncbi:hypothetical protein A3Q34_04810 [Colwellia sp. PAMC 20917]|uniref:protein DpdD n=1 Tax=Colwellia sp. PAMC 20917 TaxID=1816218 RepID=UPI00087D31A8|nr:protein DpdD [Colwellia sp. PAMC 20917]AOW76236.1 hypothetical protein A3Q34_04810 [Colwellia sp. PAMC 20917]
MTFSNYPSWFVDFFTAENEIELEKPVEEISDSINLLLLKSIRNLESKTPFFLPAYVNGQLYFYGMCPDTKSLNELKNCLYYGLGSSHTSSYEIIKSPELKFEQSLLQNQSHGVIKFSQVITDSFKQDTSYVVTTLNEVSARFEAKPNFPSVRLRPIGRILRDFFLASRESDGESALVFYNEAKGSGKLSHRNLVGLELQSLAINASWHEILEHKNLPDYLAGIIPTRIYHLLVRALMHVNNLDLTDLSNVDWVGLKSSLVDYESFLLSKPRLKEEDKYKEDWEAWSALAISIGIDKNDIISFSPSFITEEWVSELFGKIESFIEARNALSIESSGLQALFDSPISLDVVTQVLDYSKVCMPSEASEIFSWLEELPFEIRQKTKASAPFRKLWSLLEDFIYGSNSDPVIIEESEIFDTTVEKSKGSVINSWNDWFKYYSSGELINFDLISEWKPCEFDINFITEKISNSADTESIRNVAPHLLSWLDDNKIETTGAFWLGLIELIAMDDETSYITIGLMRDLIQGLLNTPHSIEQYSSAIEAFEVIVKVEISRKSLPIIIEFSEMLFDYAIKSPEVVRYPLWNGICQYSITHWSDIDFELQTVLTWLDKHIAPEDKSFDHLMNKDDSSNEEVKVSLKDKLIGISTLTEKAGQRAGEILQSLFPGVVVKLNHDKVATDKLKNLASTADYFIFCNKSAAHQSYYAVKAINKDIIYCDGKGSSSIMRSLLDYLNKS